MSKITFGDIVHAALNYSYSDDARKAAAIRDALRHALVVDGVAVNIPGVGILQPVRRAARIVRNPHTGEPIDVPARRAVIFRPAAALKRALNGEKESGE